MKNKITYNKLIRDNIPNVIENSGMKYKIHIANDDEYKASLLKKLIEEAKELQEEPCIEELADIMEVIDSIKTAFDFSDQDIIITQENKRANRGGFKERMILEHVYED